ncbi:saccharopine dehydrogenase NADP-binding domain-containing protein [Sphaerisporangium dianthi]|uniref:Saccharopine dehydrogenase NADP-binding domain-containing protein n=1 Tax=Sphaerisporangium dianthi TaxID=1436120 RepID=A0ABV9CVA0_9ACTN
MSPGPLVAILGGYGAVGSVAARCLAAESGVRLRVGGRDPGAAARTAASLPGGAEAMAVDAADEGALARFAAGCAVLLNCAGPAYELAGRPRAAAAAAGAAYVDVMDGSGPGPGPDAERTAVLSAGLSPGLSGMLPRLLADGLARPVRFSGGYAWLGTFTRTGALDYLLSLERDFGTPLARWRSGRVVRDRGERVQAVAGAPRPITVYPYMPEELVRQARTLGLAEAEWVNGFDGRHLLDTLSRVRARPDGEPGEAAEAIVRASALDALGRSPYHLLWGELDGRDAAGVLIRRSVLIRGEDGSALTGVVGAVAARETALGRVPDGAHEASQVLAAASVVEAVRTHLPGTAVVLSEEPLDGAPLPGPLEEGAL